MIVKKSKLKKSQRIVPFQVIFCAPPITYPFQLISPHRDFRRGLRGLTLFQSILQKPHLTCRFHSKLPSVQYLGTSLIRSSSSLFFLYSVLSDSDYTIRTIRPPRIVLAASHPIAFLTSSHLQIYLLPLASSSSLSHSLLPLPRQLSLPTQPFQPQKSKSQKARSSPTPFMRSKRGSLSAPSAAI